MFEDCCSFSDLNVCFLKCLFFFLENSHTGAAKCVFFDNVCLKMNICLSLSLIIFSLSECHSIILIVLANFYLFKWCARLLYINCTFIVLCVCVYSPLCVFSVFEHWVSVFGGKWCHVFVISKAPQNPGHCGPYLCNLSVKCRHKKPAVSDYIFVTTFFSFRHIHPEKKNLIFF